jgi:hypothetical protein
LVFRAAHADWRFSFQVVSSHRQLGRQVRRRRDQATDRGEAAAGYDANWLRNAVQEALDEANIDGLEID